MWFYVFLGIAIVLGLAVFYILQYRIELLEKENTKLKYDYEDRILDILHDVKRMENKYATSGTELCKYIDSKIAFHNKKWFKYKNELNIAGNETV